jgi:hypothetical protein
MPAVAAVSVAASKQRTEARAKNDCTNDCIGDRAAAPVPAAVVFLLLLSPAVTATP